MSDVKEPLSITLPLYQWLTMLGALGNLNDQTWYDRLADQILDRVQP